MIAKTLTIKALDKDIKDAYWIDVKKILHKYNLTTEKVDDFFCIKNEKDTAVDPRSYILMLRRESREITGLANIDTANVWHPCSIGFWNNKKLSYYQQRLLFAHLHNAEVLRSRPDKPYPTCHVCHIEATWYHVFTECQMVNFELEKLYNTWDSLSIKYNFNKLRLPPDHSSVVICVEWTGVVNCNQTCPLPNNKRSTEWWDEVYSAFAVFVESCYKNCTWNNDAS